MFSSRQDTTSTTNLDSAQVAHAPLELMLDVASAGVEQVAGHAQQKLGRELLQHAQKNLQAGVRLIYYRAMIIYVVQSLLCKYMYMNIIFACDGVYMYCACNAFIIDCTCESCET